MENFFLIVFSIMAAYVGIGNYVYFKKVIPTLKKENSNIVGSFLPSNQQEHMQRYIETIEENEEKFWYYYYLKYNNVIVSVIFALIVLFAISLYIQR